jgi:23S rRNA pseudouridine2605 synthase
MATALRHRGRGVGPSRWHDRGNRRPRTRPRSGSETDTLRDPRRRKRNRRRRRRGDRAGDRPASGVEGEDLGEDASAQAPGAAGPLTDDRAHRPPHAGEVRPLRGLRRCHVRSFRRIWRGRRERPEPAAWWQRVASPPKVLCRPALRRPGQAPARRVLAPEYDAPKLHKVLAQSGVGSRRRTWSK